MSEKVIQWTAYANPLLLFYFLRSLIFRMEKIEIGSGGGTRTPDQAVNSRLLYRLSYS